MKKHDNQVPSEEQLTRWMDDELEGDELARMESWAQDRPEFQAERDAVRAMRSEIRANIPASVEPPYREFFNQRILRAIENDQLAANKAQARHGNHWMAWLLNNKWMALPTAAAAMAMCFYLGMQVNDQPQALIPTAAISTQPVIYTPDGDIKANIFSPTDNGATVIVLEGLDDIPDELEIAGEPYPRETGQSSIAMVKAGMSF